MIHRSEWSSLKSLHIINMRKGVEKMEPSDTAGGHLNWYRPDGNSMEVPQKLVIIVELP